MFKRKSAAVFFGIFIFFIGTLCALSFNLLEEFKILGLNIFDLFDKLAANWLMPLAGLLTAVFVGWRLGRPAINELLKEVKIPYIEETLLWTIRIVVPVSIFIIFIRVIFVG